jgi:hypothetical protein
MATKAVLAVVQITSYGLKTYINAIGSTFGDDVDFAQLVKIYGKPSPENEVHRRYSPTPCIGAKRERVTSGRKPFRLQSRR